MPLLLATLFAAVAYLTRFLNVSGALVAGLFGFCILRFGGWEWAVAPLVFFVLSSVLSAFAKSLRSPSVQEQTRGSRRDAIQVLSNGGVGWVLLALYAYRPESELIWVYTASFAAAAADTWATEVGTASAGRTISIVGGRPVNPGTSGGVSIAGSVASLAGAGSVMIAMWLVLPPATPWRIGAAVLAGAIAGSIVDSVLGATIQGKAPGINNDTVNLACTLTGAAAASLILYIWP